MDFLKSVNWEQLTAIVTAAIAFGVFAIGAICVAIVRLVPRIKEAREAIESLTKKVAKQEAIIDKHKETIINLAEASPQPTKELLKSMV